MTSYKVLKITDFNFSEFYSLHGLVTPQLAAELLCLNMENNRRIDEARVKQWANIMRQGDWAYSDPIKFSDDGKMIDGQHRLSAVIKVGEAQPFAFLIGYDKKSAETLDQGKKRTAKDIANIRGLNIGHRQIAVMRMLTLLHHGYSPNAGTYLNFTNSQIVTTCQIYSDLLDFVFRHSAQKTAIIQAPVLASVGLAYYKENHQRLDEFLYCWHGGCVKHGPEDNAAIALRTMYYKSKESRSSHTDERIKLALKAQSALLAFLKKKDSKGFKGLSNSYWDTSRFSYQNLTKQIKEFDA